MSAITSGIATYNREKLVKRAVKSVINQSFQNFKNKAIIHNKGK